MPDGFNRTYEGKAAQQNMPITLVEYLMHEVFNHLSDVETEAESGRRSLRWNDLVRDYKNLQNRTRRIVDDKEYQVHISDTPPEACKKIKEYMNRLQDYNVFKIGQDEVLLQ